MAKPCYHGASIFNQPRHKPVFYFRFAFIAVVLCCVMLFLAAGSPHNLDQLRSDIKKQYPNISHLHADKLVSSLDTDKELLIFDVREKEEYQVSHIPGSIRVDPGIWTSTFIKKFGDRVRGKNVVFYCSIGVRSSRLATRVVRQLKEKGASKVQNLDGGVFYWHGVGYKLKDPKGPTTFVHPYNPFWGQLVERRNLIRTQTQTSAK